MVEILSALLFIWLGVSIGLFMVFNVQPYTVTLTHTDTNEKETLTGYKKVLVSLLVSFLWPIVIIKNIIEKE